MGMEFKKPLIIGDIDASVKSDISQIKQDVSDIETDIGSLDNLTTTDKSSLVGAINEVNTLLPPTSQKDYIDNSKAMPTGEVSTNSLILPEIEEYAHSTYVGDQPSDASPLDPKKFTKVGNPVITDDGIASGFSGYPSSASFVYTPSIPTDKPFKLKIKGKTDSLRRGGIVGRYGSSGFGASFTLTGGNQVILALRGQDGTNILNETYFSPLTKEIAENINFEFTLEWTGTKYITRFVDEFGDLCFENITDSSAILHSGRISVGGDYVSGALYGVSTGSIDLKQFAITVDGVEVFSGNKTGIDTIKPSNFTANTSSPSSPFVNPSLPFSDSGLTISADGIASGFSASNYVVKNSILPTSGTHDLEIEFKYNHKTNGSASQYLLDTFLNPALANKIIASRINADNVLQFVFHNEINNIVYDTVTLEEGSSYLIKIKTDLNTYFKAFVNGVEKVSETYSLAGRTLANGNTYLGWVSFSGGTEHRPLVSGSIDLNAFKIYVDGNLVYQPCLKIPYTESKTGSKIVNSIYRDRVNDMADQFGYANYYTLDEDNGNFTLPQVELYGLIGQRTLRDSYRNGINYWELYSNRDLEQGGSCTSGVEVTFPKPFADTNYVLSVPYSAKSATAFTPTQTGDWIAKGKGLL